MASVNVLFCGVGGQGIVLASRLVAESLLLRGAAVRAAETIGMAQRGGSVLSHVRAGRNTERPYAPLLAEGEADLLIAFEPGEAIRSIRYLKPGGSVLSLVRPISKPQGSATTEDQLDYLLSLPGPVALCDASEICERLGSYRLENTALLGTGAKLGFAPLEKQSLLEAVDAVLKPRWRPLNRSAVEEGAAVLRFKP